LSELEIAPLKGSVFVDISATIGFTILDILQGGFGVGVRKIRNFSIVEHSLLEKFQHEIINPLPKSWQKIMPIRPQVKRLETNNLPDDIYNLHNISSTDNVVFVWLNIKVGYSEGMLSFCLPHSMLEPIRDRLS
jgi:flagellar motor switch protein FliM